MKLEVRLDYPGRHLLACIRLVFKTGTWRYNGHEGLWFIPGSFSIARFNGRLAVLQIQSALRGIRIPRYEETPNFIDLLFVLA